MRNGASLTLQSRPRKPRPLRRAWCRLAASRRPLRPRPRIPPTAAARLVLARSQVQRHGSRAPRCRLCGGGRAPRTLAHVARCLRQRLCSCR
jgi:hypothetical protein